MSIQIFGLRPNPRNPSKATEVLFKPRAKSVESLFLNYKKILSDIPEEEHYNLFWTAAHCVQGTRNMISQDIIPFDIDHIFQEEKDSYLPIIASTLGVKLEDCVSLYTGNGIQFIVKLKTPFKTTKYFEIHKDAYKDHCRRMAAALDSEGLLVGEGKHRTHVDSSVFCHARILRLPGTDNRKPFNSPFGDDVVPKPAVLVGNKLQYSGFVLKDPEKVDTSTVQSEPDKDYGAVDAPYVLEECLFLKACLDGTHEVHEPDAYAFLGVTGYLKDNNTIAKRGMDIFRASGVSDTISAFTDECIEHKIEQATRASGPRTCKDISERWDGCPKCPHHGRVNTPLRLRSKEFISTEATGFTIIGSKGAVNYQYGDLLKYFARENHFVTIPEIKRFMTYNGTHYTPIYPLQIKKFAEDHFDPDPKETHRVEFLNKVAANNQKDVAWLNHLPIGYVNCRNGVLDVEKKELVPHSHDMAFQYCLPYDYVKDAKCPTWDKLILTICQAENADGTIDTERFSLVQVIEEFLGYALYGGPYEYNKALILSGEGSNGKSTLLEVVRYLFGDHNVSGAEIHKLGEPTVASQMEGKLLNISEEEKTSCFQETGPFKRATSVGKLSVRRLYENPFDIETRAKIIMSYNIMPWLGDISKGMKRRLMIVPCEIDYDSNPDLKIEKVVDKCKEELPGILNRCLEGFARVQKQRGFTSSSLVDRELNKISLASDPVLEWYGLGFYMPTNNIADRVPLKEMYDEYITEMEAGKSRGVLSLKGFKKRLESVMKERGTFVGEIKKYKLEGKSVRCVPGLKRDEEGEQY